MGGRKPSMPRFLGQVPLLSSLFVIYRHMLRAQPFTQTIHFSKEWLDGNTFLFTGNLKNWSKSKVSAFISIIQPFARATRHITNRLHVIVGKEQQSIQLTARCIQHGCTSTEQMHVGWLSVHTSSPCSTGSISAMSAELVSNNNGLKCWHNVKRRPPSIGLVLRSINSEKMKN